MKWLALLGLVLTLGLGSALAWLYHQGARGVQDAQKVATAQDQTAVANLNTAGVRQSEQRVKITVATQQTAAQLAAQYRAEAQHAGDAHAPLDPGRAERLHASDVQLCGTDPDLAGCPAH
ncbi:MAG TPA: hypothetical protein VJP88_05240 [Caulobacteraceae bacterium]|nr:hypothetical protein [Caulobacteraceae bacterium]